MCSEECNFNRVEPVPGLGQLVVSLSLCRPWFGPRPVSVGFAVDKVVLGRFFFIYFGFFLSLLTH